MNPMERLSPLLAPLAGGQARGTAERLPSTEDVRLRRTALQLEGLFVQRMFAAMRETVPQDGMTAQSSAESTFSSLLDEKLAEQVPSQWNGTHSLAEALYRQLRQRIEPVSPPSTDTQPQTTVQPFHEPALLRAERAEGSTVPPQP